MGTMNRREFARFAALSGLAGLLPQVNAATADKPVIALVLKSMRNQFFTEMADGAKDYYAHHNKEFSLLVDGIDVETDYASQKTLIRQLTNQHIRALLIVPADSVALLPTLEGVMKTGTLVINLDNKLDDRAMAVAGVNVPFVGPSNFVGARTIGEFVAKQIPSGSKVALIEGPPAHINAKARSDGYREAMRGAGIEVVGVESGYWEVEGGRKAATALLQKTPNIAALLCGNDNMAIGATEAVASAGRRGKVLVTGYDNIPDVRPYIADGRIIATADQFPAKVAEYGLDLAIKAIRENTLQADLPTIVQTPVQLVTHK